MRSILIVGNETLAGSTLAEAISERLAAGPASASTSSSRPRPSAMR